MKNNSNFSSLELKKIDEQFKEDLTKNAESLTKTLDTISSDIKLLNSRLSKYIISSNFLFVLFIEKEDKEYSESAHCLSFSDYKQKVLYVKISQNKNTKELHIIESKHVETTKAALRLKLYKYFPDFYLSIIKLLKKQEPLCEFNMEFHESIGDNFLKHYKFGKDFF